MMAEYSERRMIDASPECDSIFHGYDGAGVLHTPHVSYLISVCLMWRSGTDEPAIGETEKPKRGDRMEKKVELVNLTPHKLVVYREDGSTMELPPSGMVARVDSEQYLYGDIDGIPVMRTTYKGIYGLPNAKHGVIYVTSSVVAQMSGRKDVIAPDTGPGGAVRDSSGRIIGVRRFQVYD